MKSHDYREQVLRGVFESLKNDASTSATYHMAVIPDEVPDMALEILEELNSREGEAATIGIGQVAYNSNDAAVISKCLEMLSHRNDEEADYFIALIGIEKKDIGPDSKDFVAEALSYFLGKNPQPDEAIYQLMARQPLVRQFSLVHEFMIPSQSRLIESSVRKVVDPDNLIKMPLEDCQYLKDVLAKVAHIYPNEIPDQVIDVIDDTMKAKVGYEYAANKLAKVNQQYMGLFHS